MEKLNFQIGTKKNPVLIALKEFKGRRLIDIRKFFQSKNEPVLVPTKKGISLNQLQFRQFIDVLNNEAENISYFFKDNIATNKNIVVNTTQGSIGRSFDMEYNNGNSCLNISEELSYKLGKDNIDFFKNILDCVYLSAIDVIDDEDDVEMFLDILNKNINKREW